METSELREMLDRRRQELGLTQETPPEGPVRLGDLLPKLDASRVFLSDAERRACRICGSNTTPVDEQPGAASLTGRERLQLRSVRPTCPACRAAMEESERANQAAHAAASAQRRLGLYADRFPLADMGLRLLNATLESFRDRPGAEASKRLTAEYAGLLPAPDPPGLLLWGGTGNGKSSLAAAAAHRARELDMAVAWIHCPTWLRNIGTLESDAREALLVLAGRADLLVLDELAGGKLTPARVDWLLYLIDERYRHGRPLIVTANYDPDRLAQLMDAAGAEGRSEDGDDVGNGQRIMDRLAELCVIVHNQATSYRLEMAGRRGNQ